MCCVWHPTSLPIFLRQSFFDPPFDPNAIYPPMLVLVNYYANVTHLYIRLPPLYNPVTCLPTLTPISGVPKLYTLVLTPAHSISPTLPLLLKLEPYLHSMPVMPCVACLVPRLHQR